jgi:hypothetical protein
VAPSSRAKLWVVRTAAAVIGLVLAVALCIAAMKIFPGIPLGPGVPFGVYGAILGGYGLVARKLRPASWVSSFVALLLGGLALGIGGYWSLARRTTVLVATSGDSILRALRDEIRIDGYRDARELAIGAGLCGAAAVVLGLGGLGMAVANRRRQRRETPAEAPTATAPLVSTAVAVVLLLPNAGVLGVAIAKPVPTLETLRSERIEEVRAAMRAGDQAKACDYLDEEYDYSGPQILDAQLSDWRTTASDCVRWDMARARREDPRDFCLLLRSSRLVSLLRDPKLRAIVLADCPKYRHLADDVPRHR